MIITWVIIELLLIWWFAVLPIYPPTNGGQLIKRIHLINGPSNVIIRIDWRPRHAPYTTLKQKYRINKSLVTFNDGFQLTTGHRYVQPPRRRRRRRWGPLFRGSFDSKFICSQLWPYNVITPHRYHRQQHLSVITHRQVCPHWKPMLTTKAFTFIARSRAGWFQCHQTGR